MLDDIIEIAVELLADLASALHTSRKELRGEIVALMRQAHEGQPLTSAMIDTDALTPDMLCCPLTPQQLRDIRACTDVLKRELSFDVVRCRGFRQIHMVIAVTLHFEGKTASGLPVAVSVDKAPVHIALRRGKPYTIEEITSHSFM